MAIFRTMVEQHHQQIQQLQQHHRHHHLQQIHHRIMRGHLLVRLDPHRIHFLKLSINNNNYVFTIVYLHRTVVHHPSIRYHKEILMSFFRI